MTPAIHPVLPLPNLKQGVASTPTRMYRPGVTVNPVADLGRSFNLARRRPIPLQALFLRLHIRVMAAVRGTPSGVPGAKFPVGQPAYSCLPNSLGRERRQLHIKLGAVPMHALNPSEIPREHQRAYCSKLLKTLLRYSTPSELSRITTTLEGEVAKTLATRFVPGLNDASYEVYRSFWLKGGVQ